MRKKIFSVLLLIFSLTALSGCKSKKELSKNERITINSSMIDSIKKVSDSIYVKPYFTSDFAIAEYYINKKDTTLTQLMRDKDSVIRQVIITKNKVRIYIAQYYGNGQLKQKYELDNFGQYNGYSKEYYENGFVKSSGIYKNGFHAGEWKNYNIKGIFVSIDKYNNNGQIENTIYFK